ncbi:SurA N-terminal domain-containing protein [Sporichthya brevicatena]|uniref:SurA N-terminal domain-containing protein n=1 Tax=Sporichthya brevicatena TaxID=171442 RepID=A0ABP3SJB5_9ACTN
MNRSRRVALLFAAVVTFGGLSACEPSQLGAAAIVEDQRITVSEIQGYLDQVRDQRKEYGLPTQLDRDAARVEVERRVLNLVFERAAQQMNIRVTEAEIEKTRAAETRSADEIAELAAQNNVTADSLDEVYRRFTIERLISEAIEQQLPNAGEVQLNEEFARRLVAVAESLRIKVNPRYGTFDPKVGQVIATQWDFLKAPKG